LSVIAAFIHSFIRSAQRFYFDICISFTSISPFSPSLLSKVHSLLYLTLYCSPVPVTSTKKSTRNNRIMQYHSQSSVRKRLDYYYRAVNAVILNRQNPTTGLIPASVAVTTHGDYRDAWVRYV
jgi:hypothetical protein